MIGFFIKVIVGIILFIPVSGAFVLTRQASHLGETFTWFIVLIVFILLFGPDEVPTIAKKAGQLFRQVTDVKDSINDSVNNEINDIKKIVKKD